MGSIPTQGNEIFSFLLSGNEAKCGVEIGYSAYEELKIELSVVPLKRPMSSSGQADDDPTYDNTWVTEVM